MSIGPRRPHADATDAPAKPDRIDRSAPAPFPARWGESLDRRASRRKRRRLPCELYADGRHASGLTVDLSSRGMFVQTLGTWAPGTRLSLEVREGPRTHRLAALVVRRRVVPARLTSVSRGGLGLELRCPAATTNGAPSQDRARRD